MQIPPSIPKRWIGPLTAAVSLSVAARTAPAQQLPRDPIDIVAPRFITAPVLAPNPNPAVPLAAKITFTADEECQVELSIKDGERSWSVLAESRYETVHEVPVLGLRANRTHEIWTTVRDAAGNERTWSEPLTFTTPPVPDFFPPVLVNVREPALQEPGLTFFSATSSRFTDSFLLAVDETGEVIWYYQTPDFVGDARRISNGNILYLSGRYAVTEIDMYGDVQTLWWAARLHGDEAPPGAVLVDANSFHHDIIELPQYEEADFAVLSAELRVYPDYPADEDDPDETNPVSQVAGDVILEFRRDGTVVRTLPLLDVIDPYRISYDSLQDFWNPVFEQGDTEDWTHGNALFFDPSDETYVYSARHQEAVVRFRRQDLGLVWILGPHERWTAPWDGYLLQPVGRGFEWNYHQHAPEITSAGTILMFDNGNGRAVAPDPELPEQQRYSRAVEYRVDPVAMTVEQVWSYGGPSAPFYSPSLGDADELPITGNVLVADGDRDAPGTHGFGRVVELTRTQPPVVVFELLILDLAPTQPVHWSVYRSEHLSGIFPYQL